MKRDIVRMMCRSFAFTGISVTDERYTKQSAARLLVVLFLLLCTHVSLATYAYINRRKFDDSITTVGYAGSTILLMVVVLKFVHCRSQLRYLLRTIDANVYAYAADDESRHLSVMYERRRRRLEWPLDERNVWRVHAAILGYQSFGFALAGISPIVGYALGNTETFLLYPGWTPWRISGLASFALVYAYQWVTAGCVFWIYYLAQQFVVFVASELLRQNRRLRRTLATIDERSTQSRESGEPPQRSERDRRLRYAKAFQNHLRQSIEHHQTLVKLFQIFKSWFEVVFLVELTLGALSFSFVFYNLLDTNRYESYLSLIGASFVSISSLFTRCVAGEIFSTMVPYSFTI